MQYNYTKITKFITHKFFFNYVVFGNVQNFIHTNFFMLTVCKYSDYVYT